MAQLPSSDSTPTPWPCATHATHATQVNTGWYFNFNFDKITDSMVRSACFTICATILGRTICATILEIQKLRVHKAAALPAPQEPSQEEGDVIEEGIKSERA